MDTVGTQWGCSGSSRCWCKMVNSHGVLSKYGWWGPLPLVQKGQPTQWVTQWMQWGCSGSSRCWCKKGQLTQCTQQIQVVRTITFSAKRSSHAVGNAVDTVGVGAKRSTHIVYSANMGGGAVTFSAKRSVSQ